MNKEERDKGEALLCEWAYAHKRCDEIQKEIKAIKKDIPHHFLEGLEGEDIKNAYEEVLLSLLQEIEKTLRTYLKVNFVVNELGHFEKQVLIDRYKKEYIWDKIAMNNHISRTTCFAIKNKVIKEILKRG